MSFPACTIGIRVFITLFLLCIQISRIPFLSFEIYLEGKNYFIPSVQIRHWIYLIYVKWDIFSKNISRWNGALIASMYEAWIPSHVFSSLEIYLRDASPSIPWCGVWKSRFDLNSTIQIPNCQIQIPCLSIVSISIFRICNSICVVIGKTISTSLSGTSLSPPPRPSPPPILHYQNLIFHHGTTLSPPFLLTNTIIPLVACVTLH